MKAYAVVKFGGDWEDKWESIDSVYLTRESAEKRASEIEKGLNSPMTKEDWRKLTEEVDDYEFDNDKDFKDYVEGILFLHPEWENKKDVLKSAEEAYYYNSDTYGAMVEETEFYNK